MESLANYRSPESCVAVREGCNVPNLGSLGNYGGPTQTKIANPGSPAIDAASCANAPATDQRGVTRPQGASCDIGAVERKAIEDTIFLEGFEGH
jgi:hypothetical protein